jgi:ElaB/YqjD/DUF883 family membrane-anchored ribosome-binding protein
METAFAKTLGARGNVESARAAMSAAVDEGKEAARRVVRRGIRAVEDLEQDAVHEVRKHPVTTVALTFGVGIGVGVGAGLLLGWLLARIQD